MGTSNKIREREVNSMDFTKENIKEMRFQSITYGQQDIDSALGIIKERVHGSENDFTLYVGTDSQSHSRTKIVTVIAVIEHGKGGFWFHTIDWTKRFGLEELRVKIYNETHRSIEIAKYVLEFMFENDIDINIMVHADLGRGKFSKTADMIREVVGWIEAEGFPAEVKPQSWAASTIADRISK